MIDRTFCAKPRMHGKAVAPCGERATVRAPLDSGYTWAYCERHAAQELYHLDLEASEALYLGNDAVEHMRKAETLRAAIGEQ